VTVKFWDLVGPTGGILGSLEVEGELAPVFRWSLYGGLWAELRIRAELPIFGWGIGYGPVEVMDLPPWLLAQGPEFDLTITSTEGGEVTLPGEGTFTYLVGEEVYLVAIADDGYQFVSWTGDVDTIANPNSRVTTITMDDHYSITASFAEEEPGLADSRWPKFRQNPQNTGRSPYTGPATPELKWSFTTGGYIRSSPAIVVDGTIYVGSSDGKLYAMNPDGSEKWSFTTGNSVQSSPAIGADGTIYVGSFDGRLYAIGGGA